MKRISFHSRKSLLFSLLLFMACAGTASAVKPTPPLSAECSTVSSTGKVFNVRCVIRDAAGTAPDKITALPVPDKAVVISDVRPPAGVGLGEWLLTMEISEKKTVAIPFEAEYSGGLKVRVGAGYDPFNLSPGAVPTPKGRIIGGKDGSSVHEYMSK